MTQREMYVAVKVDHDFKLSAVNGSKDLCAAILATGRTHGPMTNEQQIAAIEYAHDISYIDGIMIKTKRDK